ncbi:UPF0481 protein At3g47200-like [Camellia sinensis]|uniref:Uncharacterized protein n=2 Tax=Camellia sinensis TaxID=4442 RepID=A0A4S4E5W9_CAMSN|nr:UPF0481 protein At3g47200-like [Camellia sinensis]THG11373.1 hypothetical protein TEA_018875 [Camellia sinensis var. sinensis]
MQEHTVDIEEREAMTYEPPCIFRVHEELRNVNTNAYTPRLVSIGPYHHGQPKLLAMEKHKERYLELVLQRTHQTQKHYLNSMKMLEERARKYYADPIDLDSDKFVKMMLYDACFIVEFLDLVTHYDSAKFQRQQGQQSQDVGHDYDPIVNTSWMKAHICCDLMRLENQLPFFVIFKFFSISTGTQNSNQNPPSTFIPMQSVTYPFCRIMPKKFDISIISFKDTSVSESKHFLDLLHNVYRPSSREKSNECQNKNQRTSFMMPSVIELRDAGIKFEVVEDDDKPNLSIFDIRFEHGHFKIPKFEVDDWTETFFRNIIAYEQHSSDDKQQYFTDYTYFMGLLINSKEDVKQLRSHGVLDNCLGDDEEVALMFNKLGHGTIIEDQLYYAEMCSEVNAHCKRWWNKTKASLKRDYFKNIWVTVATMAAAFLLLLTITQTVIALIMIIISPPSRR